MLLIIFFATAFAQGTVISSEEKGSNLCDESFANQQCKFQGSDTFPETEREVEIYCSALVGHNNCWLSFLKRCNRLGEGIPPQRQLYDSGVLLDLCNKKYTLYEDFVENAKCIADTLKDIGKNGLCINHVNALKETPDFEEKMQYLHSGFEAESREKLGRCAGTVFRVGCLGITLKKNCGETAQHLLLWVVDKSGFLKIDCKEEHEPVIKKYIKLMQLDMNM